MRPRTFPASMSSERAFTLHGTAAMLVLTRKLNESILIGDNVEITVSSIRGNRVRIAISAPPEVPVMRREVAEQFGGCLFALTTPTPASEQRPAPRQSSHAAT